MLNGKNQEDVSIVPTGAAVAILPVFPRDWVIRTRGRKIVLTPVAPSLFARESPNAGRGCNDLTERRTCADGNVGGGCRITRHPENSLAAQVAELFRIRIVEVTPGAPRLLSTRRRFHGSDGVHLTRDQGVWTMFAVRRLLAVGSVLMLVGLLASTHLWGKPRGEKSPLSSTDPKRPTNLRIDPHAAAEMSLSRFNDQPLVLYHRPDQKETLLAVQVKPRLKAVAPRPRDYLVLLDTAAHMARGDFKTAQVLRKSSFSASAPRTASPCGPSTPGITISPKASNPVDLSAAIKESKGDDLLAALEKGAKKTPKRVGSCTPRSRN